MKAGLAVSRVGGFYPIAGPRAKHDGDVFLPPPQWPRISRQSRMSLRSSGLQATGSQLGRGHAADTASASQLTIRSVPPLGAAIGNRLWPAYCRKVRSPANKAAATTKPQAATNPSRR